MIIETQLPKRETQPRNIRQQWRGTEYCFPAAGKTLWSGSPSLQTALGFYFSILG